jgi:predicted ribosome quality control (RQC) complex YloA/Tae2 family protein
MAACHELRQTILPARLEQVYQPDRFTVCLALRTMAGRQWLTLSWHPQAARICLDGAPPKVPDPFNFSQQLWHQLGSLALVEIANISTWERVVDLRFAQRPGDPILWHLYVEIMGQYSNVVLVNQENQIVTAAYQVGERQSRLRSLQTSTPYERPPTLVSDTPSVDETFASWWQKITLIPGKLSKNITSVYRGLSTALVQTMLQQSNMPLDLSSDRLTPAQGEQIFAKWQIWLNALQTETFHPAWTTTGYTVMGWAHNAASTTIPAKTIPAKTIPAKTIPAETIPAETIPAKTIPAETIPVASVQVLLQRYYADRLAQQRFQQLHQQLQQRLHTLLEKLNHKRQGFRDRLTDADHADQPRQQADLLMAYLHLWQPGMSAITLPDFATNEPVQIPLSPDKNAVQNAQALYKRHQKWQRSRRAIEPLLNAVQAEIDYLESIVTTLSQLRHDQSAPTEAAAALTALEETRDELIQAGYAQADASHRRSPAADSSTQPRRFISPSGYEILVGRNNRQNDQLSFRTASDYDLWFHSQQIPGSHVLLRLAAGVTPDPVDLQFTANLAAYYSQARDSDQAPIVYTQPKHLAKPKGAKPGMVIYKQETVLWGDPQIGKQASQAATPNIT